ncbi:MAG: RHS repeat-associated core domain-containing protein [Gemmatimonadaceae bacterium]|nr:RHS repeat-associated core domain-containing protein [Gemmatimonadaceae bacterium]
MLRARGLIAPDGRAVTFAYDSSGNLTSVTPPGKPAHTFVYAPADRLAQYNPPTNGLPVSATGYVYNTAGQVTVLRRAVGDSIRFVYDGAGRPSSVVFDRGTLGFSYNGTTGNLTSMSAPGGQGLAFTYDGALPTSVTWSGTVSGSTAVAYNSDFRVTSQTVNGANAVSFGYDADGLLTQAGGLGLRRATNNGRLDADSITVGGATQRSTYGYDNHGALNQLTARRGTDTLFATSYVRDSLSRITQLTERVNGTTQVVAFTYDSVGRLSSVTRNGTPTASYTYDLNGNRATKTTSGGTQTAVVDDQDRLTSYGGATYQYTAHGDLRRKIVGTDTTEYTYDALGNLTRVELPNGTAIGYLLDAMNRRIGKTVNDTLVRAWLYQGQLTPVAELDGSGTVVSRFVYATGVNVPDYLVRGDSTYRIIRDHLGSVRLVVNVASGTVAQRVSYDEFGIETENTNPGWQPFGYAGGLTDSQTGLVRFGARDYDPVAVRWTAKDPIGFAGGPTGLYEYADSDPVNVVDPFGLFGLRDAASFLPVVGSALDALDAVRCGNYGMAALNLGLAAMDATGMGAIAKGLAVGTMKWSARQSIKQVRGSSSSWAQLRRGLQKIGEVVRNSGATPRRDWLTTDHIFFKQKDNWPNELLNHPANLQTGVPQWLNSAFEHMTPLERAAHLPTWMKIGAGGVASTAAGATVVGCGCN